jgi:hypothetical protein
MHSDVATAAPLRWILASLCLPQAHKALSITVSLVVLS